MRESLILKAFWESNLFLPLVVSEDGRYHDDKRANTEPGAHVNRGVPLEWSLTE